MTKGKTSKSRKVASRESRHVPSENSDQLATENIVGFGDEEKSIIDRLIGGSRQLRIVAIVGMPGLGKTTLATKVYNHLSVMLHFHVQAWCSVSQVFDEKKVLPELWSQVVKKIPDGYFEKTEEDLATKLRRSLKGKRYLIFLDDVWDLKTWNSLRIILPDDGYGSRIIITSRVRHVAPQAVLDEEPLFLRHLTDDESWELLQKKLFPGRKRCPSAFCELGIKIARNCKGLPLIIIIVARMLATMEQEGWNEVLENLNSGVISSTEQCMKTLELSYKHLPDYLKPCLLYFGAFPDDHEFSVKWLIWLWISEGFVQKTCLKSLEDVGRDYLMDLVGRSLVMVAKQRSIGGTKTCRIHDLLHDFCRTKAKEENFFHLLQGPNEPLPINVPPFVGRLCNYSKLEHFKVPKLLPHYVHSLLFFADWCQRSYYDISVFLHIFKLLEVLDMGKINLGSVFPSEMGLLKRLKYLAVRGEMEVIPSSVGNLSHLQTFIVDKRLSMVSLPQTLWNLQKLRHLYISNNPHNGFVLPIENLDNSAHLYELDSFSGVFVSSLDSMEKLMRKFPNIRKLRFKLFQYDDDDKILALDFLSRLESLSVSLNSTIFTRTPFEFCFPLNLKKLTLTYFWFPSSKISTIGNLPNLEVLKLFYVCFSGETWEIEEGEFSRLRFLKLSGMSIDEWTAPDDQFLCLEKLVLELCYLQEIPSCLESISTLQMIEVSDCSSFVESLIKQIQEEQMNLGNSALKVLIRSSKAKSKSS